MAGLALTALAAAAQTYAPAEDRPGRIVLVPMSVERPAGEDWALAPGTDTAVSFLRPVIKNRNRLVAAASVKVPDRRARTAQELAANIRDEIKSKTDDKRFEVLAEDVWVEPSAERKCVSYRQQARDKGAVGSDGKAQIIDLYGLACLHPADEGIVLNLTFYELGSTEIANPRLAEEAARFFQGMRPHAPLKGKEWQPLAEQGDANAQVWLARSLLQTNELEEAIAWLGRAADKGHLDAQTLLGLSYLSGRAVTRSPEEAVKWLRQAAEKGYPKAEGLLGWTHVNVPKVRNQEEGVRWVRKAAANGDPLGQALLGELLIHARAGVAKNEPEGAAWVRKAAEQGDANAQYELARLLANGIAMEKDQPQARFWLELSAVQGNPDARKVLDQHRSPPGPAPSSPSGESK
jgi:TPR repeat protein